MESIVMIRYPLTLLLALVMSWGVSGCAKPKMIRGTQIPDLPKNHEVIKVVEEYRRAMESLSVTKLMGLAHPHYYEHSGTPLGEDDYGYKGLLRVLKKRLRQVKALRCNLKYLRIWWPHEKQAEVEVYISASFQLRTAEGERWYRMTDYNKLVLVQHKGRWMFLRGM
jgi:hypothetical protein